MASFKPLYLPYEKPFFRDYYRSVHHATHDSARGINGPIFSRLYCGGSNANGAAFRQWGSADLSSPRGGGLPPIDRPQDMTMYLQPPRTADSVSRRMMASYSKIQQPRERSATEWHIERCRTQYFRDTQSRGSESEFMSSVKWPPRTPWTRPADGTSLPHVW